MEKKGLYIILLLGILLMIASCQTTTKSVVVTTPPPTNPCPLPSGYQLEPAIKVAEDTLNKCPEMFDEVFQRLIEIAKNSPKKENAFLIQDMLKRLVKANKISEIYAKNLYRQYFSVKFVTMPDIKCYNLPAELDNIKSQLRKELKLKRIGFIECCGDREGYKMVEAEYRRLISLLENMALNEQYMKNQR